MRQDQQKQVAAEAAVDFIETGEIIGVGTGSTTNFFILSVSSQLLMGRRLEQKHYREKLE